MTQDVCVFYVSYFVDRRFQRTYVLHRGTD